MSESNGDESPNSKSHKRVSLSNSWSQETGTLRIEWRDNQETVFNLSELPQEIVNDLCYHGLLSRIQQAYVTSKGSPEVAREKAGKLWEQLKSGDWGLSRGEKSISITVQALASLMKIPDLDALARFHALPAEKRREVSNRSDVAAEVSRLKAKAAAAPRESLAQILK